jgi:hypothetical protein
LVNKRVLSSLFCDLSDKTQSWTLLWAMNEPFRWRSLLHFHFDQANDRDSLSCLSLLIIFQT